MLVAVECDGEVQGIMAVLRIPQPARLGDGQVVYVDYLESAPWNLKGSAAPLGSSASVRYLSPKLSVSARRWVSVA
jgi:hypothetical protein